MLYRALMALTLLAVVIGDGIDDPDNNQKPGNCPDQCGLKKCNAWKSDDHKCSAMEIKQGIAVDPFRCGPPRCQPTDCSKCGDKDFCVKQCRDHKNYLEGRGYDMGDGYPSCENVCGEFLPDGADDFMCYIRCDPDRNPDTKKPQCYEHYACQENYCSAKDKQNCNAKLNAVDPWNVGRGDPCKVTNCRRCGGQDTCMGYCEDYKKNHPQEEQVNCKAECAGIQGYKCILTPGGGDPGDDEEAGNVAALPPPPDHKKDKKKKGGKKKKKDNENGDTVQMEDALRAETRAEPVQMDVNEAARKETRASSRSSIVGWPLGLGLIASLVLGEYLYRQKAASQTHKRIA